VTKIVYTIGHSNRSLSKFLKLLKDYKIVAVVDVRRFPTSRRFPHFKKENLEKELEKNNIKYFWLGESLGGLRPITYEEYMKTKDFEKGLKELIEIIEKYSPAAIMCKERLWFKCHRRFISDRLIEEGYQVIHIIDEENTYKHKRRPSNSKSLFS